MSAHIPVMLNEVVDALRPRDGAIYVDGTFGGGGYTHALLSAANCSVYGIDRDPDAIARGQVLAKQFDGRLTLIHGRFSEMEALLAARGAPAADGIALDLGVSSFQLDEATRGFSFREDGPLDMRMEGAAGGQSAADVVNNLPEAELADIIWRYGEEKRSRSIARAIVAARPILRTRQLAEIVERAAGPGAKRFAIHPATRTFQALRIYVNDELGELERGLAAAERTLKAQGRLAVVAFHSLEDRIVKHFIAERSGKSGRGSRHAPAMALAEPSFNIIPPNPVQPGDDEVRANPRARSAKLRVAERTGVSPRNAAHGEEP